jgi:hypothetical protein
VCQNDPSYTMCKANTLAEIESYLAYEKAHNEVVVAK